MTKIKRTYVEPAPLDPRYIIVENDGKLRVLAPSVTITREEAEEMFLICGRSFTYEEDGAG